jgi:cbb3-type cytochrome oxidase maturation protein
MTVIFLLIGISVLLGGGFLIAFFWSVKSGQTDDLYTPSVRMLFEDEIKKDAVEPTADTHKQSRT